MKKYFKTKTRFWVFISVIICLISMIGTNIIQTNFGSVKMENIKFITESGHRLGADLYIPDNATQETPAPAIVYCHGGNTTKELSDMYAIELSRRGYVVMLIDMYSHGQSESLDTSEWLDGGRGVYDAAKFIHTLPYVDVENICLIGHSRGGKASSESILLDNEAEESIVSAVYLVASDPIYKDDDGNFVDVYGSRSVGVMSDAWDPFYFSEKAEDTGTFDNIANRTKVPLSNPVDYVNNKSAQSFLNFGENPENVSEMRAADTVYEKEFDDGIGIRTINPENVIHGQGAWSGVVIKDVIEFVQRVMPAANSISADSQIWQISSFLGMIGIVGLVMFMVSLALALTETNVFEKAKVREDNELVAFKSTKACIWFWCSQVISIVLAIAIVYFLIRKGINNYYSSFFQQMGPRFFGIWGILNSIITLLLFGGWYLVEGKKEGFDFKESGIKLEKKAIIPTILTAVIAAIGVWGIVFFADWAFHTEFTVGNWMFFSFSIDKVPNILKLLPMFLIFYIVHSLSINCFNYFRIAGKNKVVNDIVISLLASGAPIALTVWYWGKFTITNVNPMFAGDASAGDCMFNAAPVVVIASLISRKIYEKTKNPYLAGILNAIVIVIFSSIYVESRIKV